MLGSTNIKDPTALPKRLAQSLPYFSSRFNAAMKILESSVKILSFMTSSFSEFF